MPFIKTLIHGMSKAPRYTMMRGVARFATVRNAIAMTRRMIHTKRLSQKLRSHEADLLQTVFNDIDKKTFVRTLNMEGAAFGLCLPAQIVATITQYANQAPCHADRDPDFYSRSEIRPSKPLTNPSWYHSTSMLLTAVRRLRSWLKNLCYAGSPAAILGHCQNLWV